MEAPGNKIITMSLFSELRRRNVVKVALLYAVAALCWFRVVRLQTRVRDTAAAAVDGETPLPPEYDRCMRAWFWLGWPAFVSLLGVFALMVMRPSFW